MTLFQPAVKAQLKARVALDGPTGSGKTWTALRWAQVLAGDDYERNEDGRAGIAFIDTERRSARLYAPHFVFDVLEFGKPYEVPKLIEALRAAEKAGYAVAVIDSWSHFWEGEGGVLDVVDAAAQRSGGNSFAGWKTGTPLQRNMVDEILDLDLHVIVTMRSKMEYVLTEYTDAKGTKRTRPEKLGMAPVQRAGVEYEFQIVGDLDLEHRITISKSRCDVLADKVIQPHREHEAATTFANWLATGEATVTPAQVEQLVALFASIEDEETRALLKRAFLDAYGRPEHLLAAQLEPALAWVRERVGQYAPQTDAPEVTSVVAEESPSTAPADALQRAKAAARKQPAGD